MDQDDPTYWLKFVDYKGDIIWKGEVYSVNFLSNYGTDGCPKIMFWPHNAPDTSPKSPFEETAEWIDGGINISTFYSISEEDFTSASVKTEHFY